MGTCHYMTLVNSSTLFSVFVWEGGMVIQPASSLHSYTISTGWNLQIFPLIFCLDIAIHMISNVWAILPVQIRSFLRKSLSNLSQVFMISSEA